MYGCTAVNMYGFLIAFWGKRKNFYSFYSGVVLVHKNVYLYI